MMGNHSRHHIDMSQNQGGSRSATSLWSEMLGYVGHQADGGVFGMTWVGYVSPVAGGR